MMGRLLKDRTIKPNVMLFYFCYTFFMMSVMYKNVLVFGEVIGIIYQICLILLALTCVISISKMPKKRMLALYCVTILVAVIHFTSGSNIWLSLWLLVVAGRGVKFEDVVKYDLLIKIPSLVIIPSLYFAGMTDVNAHYRGGEIRHSMGFTNPNVFSAYVMSVLAEIWYLRRTKFGLLDVMLAVVGIWLIGYFADSQTQVVCIVGFVLVFAGSRIAKKSRKRFEENVIKRVWRFMVDHAFTLGLVFSLCAVGAYATLSDGAREAMNAATHNRLEPAAEMMDEYRVNLFGQKVKLVNSNQASQTGEEVKSLDNAYAYSLLAFGAVATILYAFFMKKYMQKARAEKNVIRYVMLIYLIGGLMEHFCLEPQLNIFLLYFTQVLFDGADGPGRNLLAVAKRSERKLNG